MAKAKDFEVVQDDAGKYGAFCLRPSGCAPFASTGWTTKKQAETRMREHIAEHDDMTPMTDLDEFRRIHAPELLPG